MPKPITPHPLKVPIGQIRWLIDRLHVSASALSVMREIRKRSKAWSWNNRRAAMRYAVRVHQQNRDLYCYVMRGR